MVVDEVAELTCRDLGDDRAARAAQQAASGRLCEIARLGRSVGVHLVCCTQRPDAEAVPGQLEANLAGTVAFRVRAAVNSYIVLDSDREACSRPTQAGPSGRRLHRGVPGGGLLSVGEPGAAAGQVVGEGAPPTTSACHTVVAKYMLTSVGSRIHRRGTSRHATG